MSDIVSLALSDSANPLTIGVVLSLMMARGRVASAVAFVGATWLANYVLGVVLVTSGASVGLGSRR